MTSIKATINKSDLKNYQNSLMKYISIVVVCFFLLNCEDKQSDKKTNTSNTETTKIIKKDTFSESEVEIKAETEESFRLTDENAMEFFLQYEKENKENKVRITTSFGDIEILLFNETKFHRANFIYLTKQDYFNDTQFYRVINNFIIQAGNSLYLKNAIKLVDTSCQQTPKEALNMIEVLLVCLVVKLIIRIN